MLIHINYLVGHNRNPDLSVCTMDVTNMSNLANSDNGPFEIIGKKLSVTIG